MRSVRSNRLTGLVQHNAPAVYNGRSPGPGS